MVTAMQVGALVHALRPRLFLFLWLSQLSARDWPLSFFNTMQNSGNNDCFGNVRALERRDFYRRWTRRLVACALVAALAFGAYRGYGAWRKQHLSKQTQDFFARGDYQSAVLVARHLLQLDQNSVAACRVMADTAELGGRREALSWRERVVALEPKVAGNHVALAATALRFGQLDLARKVLDAVKPDGRGTVKYHQLAGAIAVAEKNPTMAETEFAAALQLEPNNRQLALNLATVRLASSDLTSNEKARAELAQLAENSAQRLESLRALTSDALAHNSPVSAEKWAAQLKGEKGATLADLLLYLEATQKIGAGEAALREAESHAIQSPAAAAALITWMNRHGMAQSALAWGLALPKGIISAQPVPLAIAEAYSFLQNWTALQAWVDGKDWGGEEFLRLAVLSHALHHLTPSDRSSMESQTAWNAALKATKSRPDQLAAIALLAEGWDYADDAAEAWWLIANGNENAKEALAALQRLYKSKQNSHGLLRVAKRALELNPGDLIAANNCASLGLLLTGDSSARRLAARLHRENPANAVFSATYAFALFTEGKTNDALQAMETLKEVQLRHPSVAAYYFVMLVENGSMERAHLFLSAANKAQLLPEEQQLLTAATRKLLQHDSQNVAKSVAVADPVIP
jgi:predicted Zn-dependent protease